MQVIASSEMIHKGIIKEYIPNGKLSGRLVMAMRSDV